MEKPKQQGRSLTLLRAVGEGVTAVAAGDPHAFDVAARRLWRMSAPSTPRVLEMTARLMLEELVDDAALAATAWPALARCRDRARRWLPQVDEELLAVLLFVGALGGEDTGWLPEPAATRHRLLLIAEIATTGDLRVAAFLDAALAAHDRAGHALPAAMTPAWLPRTRLPSDPTPTGR
ncbi:hypothetical protein [Micromonospora sp. DT68]|uniref:hypothetical protein n=1 Tax=unclassified Micromonospora TaxID=2617518 RepID=UPI003CFAA501